MIQATDLDIGPLAWVKSEIDQALARADEALEKAKGEADDSASIQFAQTHLHQARGALSIIGLDGLTQFASALDQLLSALVNEEISQRDKGLELALRAIAVIGNYLEELINGAPDQPLRLYPLYAEMVAARQNKSSVWVSPSDLFFPDLSPRPRRKTVPQLSETELHSRLHAARARFERGLLQWLKQPASAEGAPNMRNAAIELQNLLSSATQNTLWWTAEAFFDCLSQSALPENPEIKQICATLHREIRRLPAVSQALPERLMRSLLYWISQVPPKTERQRTVHQLWQLDALVPEAGTAITETPLAPLLSALHHDLEDAKQNWDRFCSGETEALRQFVTSVKQLADRAQPFGRPALHRLLKGINTFMVWLVKDTKQFSNVVAIEVAGALLLAETALDRGVAETSLSAQVNETLARFSAIVRGEKLQATDKTSATSTIRQSQEEEAQKQVAKEVLSNLAQIEQALDDFFRDHDKREPLTTLGGALKQIEGIMTLLAEPQAVALIRDAAVTIAGFGDGSIEPEQKKFETLAQQLSALGFYVDALQRGPAELEDYLHPERVREPAENVEQEYEISESDAADGDFVAEYGTSTAIPVERPLPVAPPAEIAEETAIVTQEPVTAAEEERPAGEPVAAAPLEPAPSPAPVQSPEAFAPAVATAEDEELDAELLDIFLEEAKEVLATIADELGQSRRAPNQESLTAIRRGFHTLKGSGRMVGLAELGEAAWSVEQTMNRWLQLEWPPTETLHAFIEEAHDVFAAWAEQISTTGGQSRDVSTLVDHAEKLRALESPDDKVEFEPAAAQEQPEIETSLEPFVAHDEALFEDFETTDLGTLEEYGGSEEFTAAPLEPEMPLETAVAEEIIEAQPLEEEIETAPEIEPEPIEAQEPVIEAESLSEAISLIEPPVVDETEPVESPSFAEEETEPQVQKPAVDEEAPVGMTEPAVTALLPVVEEISEFERSVLPDWSDLVRSSIDADIPEPPAQEIPLEEEADELHELDIQDDDEDLTLIPMSELDADIGIETNIDGDQFLVSEITEITPTETEMPETNTVTIGGIELSATLFGLFIGEAKQHIDVLHEDFEHLERNPTLIPSEQAQRSAHTLAGISGTARILPPQELARALEHALIRLRKLNTPPTAEQRALLTTTHNVLAAMLTEIEARQMPLPVPELQLQLDSLGREADAEETATPVEQISVSPDIPPLQPYWPHASYPLDRAATAPSEPSQPAPTEAESVEADQPLPERAEETAVEATPAAPLAIAETPQEQSQPTGETAQEPQAPQAPTIQDELDEQLLPIFLEESSELLSQLRATLRSWRADGDAAASARSVARLLHTMKGGARMAGAMQLGEHIHQLESRLEEATQQQRSAGDTIEMLESGLDQAEETISTLAVCPIDQSESAGPQKGATPAAAPTLEVEATQDASSANATLRVRAGLIDRFVNDAGEIGIARTRIEGELRTVRRSLLDLTENVIRLRNQLREIEIQAEVQMQSRMAQAESKHADFDPLEMDRFTRLQELTRMMAESVSDVTTVQQNLLKNLDSAEMTLQGQARLARELQQSLMQVRMVPFHSLADRLHRVVRQSAKDLDKRVNLDIRGGAIEVDRSVLEHMTAPLEHLLRNAISHGIESPEKRREAGKDEIGQITLSISHEGNEIAIVLSDDGGGLNYQAIASRAKQKGLLRPDEEADERRLANLIFLPGFSTSDNLSAVSGRGVGMDVVRAETASIGGRVDIQSTPGVGTEFHIRLPLTLAVTQALLVQAAGRTYAVPSNMITQVLEVYAETLDQLRSAGGMDWQNKRYNYHYLPRLLGDSQTQPEIQRFNWILLLRAGSQTLALHVDSLKGNQEIVVKHAGPQLVRIVGISGATVLGDGEIVLIINPVAMANRGITFDQAGPGEASRPGAMPPAPVTPTQPTVMIVDDSLTVRKITGRLLEREGYKVVTAKDGSDALEKLLEPPLPDVILSDIEMPRMDGFDLLRNIRADDRTKDIPVVMITSRLADKHKELAVQLGANNYLGKPFVEEELLTLLKEYTGGTDSLLH